VIAVSRHRAVIDKVALTRVGAPATQTVHATHATNRTAGLRPSHYAGLIARLSGMDEAPKVVAFASTRSEEAVRGTIARLAEEVERTTGMRCSTTTASDFIGPSTERARLACAQGFSTHDRRDRLADMAPESDVVLVDAGSLAQGGEILGLARKVDAIVIVVESGRTRRKELSHAVSAIGAAGGKIVGLVLYRRRPLLPGWLERLVG
jgi:hypothetical protein